MIHARTQKAVIYCRVASIPDDCLLIEACNGQEALCRELARHKDLYVLDVFRDHATGTSDDRLAFSNMLDFLRNHSDQGIVVIVDNIARLARDTLTYARLRSAIEEAEGRLVCGNLTLDDSPESRLVESLHIARMELLDTIEH